MESERPAPMRRHAIGADHITIACSCAARHIVGVGGGDACSIKRSLHTKPIAPTYPDAARCLTAGTEN